MNDEPPKVGKPRMTLGAPSPKSPSAAKTPPNGGGGAAPNPGPNKGPNPGAKGGPNKGSGQPQSPNQNAGPKPGPNAGPNAGQTQGAKPAGAKKPPVAAPSAGVRATVSPAKMKRRHWGLVVSFFALVLAPFVAVVLYMALVAEDQYATVAGFTVRKEESGGASELLGGLAGLTGAGGSTGSDSNILYEFILSSALVQRVEDETGLDAHYNARWEEDPVFALQPGASIEDLQRYWERIVRISYDQSSGLMELRVLAFSPDKAQAIARQILAESQVMINGLNEQARADAMRYANADLAEAVDRLKTAREKLTAFRTRTQIVDPDADLQGRMGVMNSLQQQLAQALIEFDLLRDQTSETDPRLIQALRKIEAIRARIVEERQNFASENAENSVDGQDYPSLIAEYEGLVVDREFAEESYRAALAALDVARAKASRQSRYLATYVEPTLAETSEYPQRITIIGLAGVFLLLAWAILALIYYSIRDRA